MTLTGDNIDAERAYDLGLVNQVVPADQVLEAGVAMAERIARNGPLALQATKELVRLSVTDPKKAIERQAEWQPKVFSSEDAKEGATRSEEHTSELQSLMRISYAVFCLKKKK